MNPDEKLTISIVVKNEHVRYYERINILYGDKMNNSVEIRDDSEKNGNKKIQGPYYFDHVFYDVNNIIGADLFREIGYPIIEGCLKGINGTIFFYGEKFDPVWDALREGWKMNYYPQNKHLINECIVHLFSRLEDLKSAKSSLEYKVAARCMKLRDGELRNYQIDENNEQESVVVTKHGTIYNEEIYTHIESINGFVNYLEDIVRKCFQNEIRGRAVDRKSNIIIGIDIEIRDKVYGKVNVQKSYFNLVHMALDTYTDFYFKEYSELDALKRSLLANECVICATPTDEEVYDCSEDSTIYRVLHDLFEDNTRISLIVTCIPFKMYKNETIRKIKFALDCKKAAMNNLTENKKRLIIRCKNQIDILKREVDNIKEDNKHIRRILEQQSDFLNEELKELKQVVESLKEKLNIYDTDFKNKNKEMVNEKNMISEEFLRIISEKEKEILKLRDQLSETFAKPN